jgi:hypothetical protein
VYSIQLASSLAPSSLEKDRQKGVCSAGQVVLMECMYAMLCACPFSEAVLLEGRTVAVLTASIRVIFCCASLSPLPFHQMAFG